MLYRLACFSCRGEGYRTQPPYDPRYHERPLRWRSPTPCEDCQGIGVRPADAQEIEFHAASLRLDYAGPLTHVA